MYDVPQNLPVHVAMIMDGNGRWARKRLLPRSAGHRAGVKSLRPIIRMSSDIGIKVLSLHAFSTENWKRSAKEVSTLMTILVEFLYKEIDELNEENIRIVFIGDLEKFPEKPREAIEYALKVTADNTGLIVNISLNYGSRSEIVTAVKKIAQKVLDGEIVPDDITDKTISDNLYTKDLPDPDLIIRTSGEKRLSNYMLYQASYTELYFSDVYWPDFDQKQYSIALYDYAKRGRRYGGADEKN